MAFPPVTILVVKIGRSKCGSHKLQLGQPRKPGSLLPLPSLTELESLACEVAAGLSFFKMASLLNLKDFQNMISEHFSPDMKNF